MVDPPGMLGQPLTDALTGDVGVHTEYWQLWGGSRGASARRLNANEPVQ
jgi:hypothetical protein